jgi:hypothetical protein
MRPVPTGRIAAGLTLLAATAALPAQVVRGRLLDDKTERPIEQATVFLQDARGETRASAITDSAGAFVLRAPGPGRYALFARRIGYRPDRTSLLELAADQVLDVDFLIAVRPLVLAPVSVTEAKMRTSRAQWVAGLDVRSLGARLIPPAKIEPLLGRASTIADVIRWQNIPGLWVQEEPSGHLCVRLVRGRVAANGAGTLEPRRGAATPQASTPEALRPGEVPTSDDDHGCMATYLDDVLTSDLEDVDPANVDKILVLLPDEAGGLYGTGSAKGVLLVYTKGNLR